MDLTNLKKQLNEVGKYVQKTYRSDLKTNDHNRTWNLSKSTNYLIKEHSDSIDIWFEGLYYYIFLEKGKKGSRKSTNKNKIGVLNKTLSANKTSAKIKRVGYQKARPYLKKIKDTVLEKYNDDIMEAFKLDLNSEINQTINKLNNDNN
jgi:hypothetical protein